MLFKQGDTGHEEQASSSPREFKKQELAKEGHTCQPQTHFLDEGNEKETAIETKPGM